MKANYSSRGYQVYGDADSVVKDAVSLTEIIERQGFDIVLESIANYVGNTVVKFKLSQDEVEAIKSSLRMSLIELIDERT